MVTGIVIVGLPRSGSTLLMGLCNVIPGVHVAGEFSLPSAGLADSLHSLSRWQYETCRGAGTRWPHYGLEDTDCRTYAGALGDALRAQIMLSAPPGTEVAGFKENCWERLPFHLFPQHTDVVNAAFGPDLLWVVLNRPQDECAKSLRVESDDAWLTRTFNHHRQYAQHLTACQDVMTVSYNDLGDPLFHRRLCAAVVGHAESDVVEAMSRVASLRHSLTIKE